MKKFIVISVNVGLLLLASSLTPSHAQPRTPADTPAFYHLVPGTYVNGWPRFTITYPKDWVEVRPLIQEVFRAESADAARGEVCMINVFPDALPLEHYADPLVGFFKQIGSDVTVVSDKPSKLRDGSPAREIWIQMKINTMPVNHMALATKRGDQLIQVHVSWPSGKPGEHLKAILSSLEFQSGFDEPVKVPPDVQEFFEKQDSDIVSHDLAKVMGNYSDGYLNSGKRKAEAEKNWRQLISGIMSIKTYITDFVPAGDRAYLAGFTKDNIIGTLPMQGTIVKENGEWKWYGNQRDARPQYR